MSLSNSGYKTKKKCGGKNVLKHAHLWRGSTQINVRVTRWPTALTQILISLPPLTKFVTPGFFQFFAILRKIAEIAEFGGHPSTSFTLYQYNLPILANFVISPIFCNFWRSCKNRRSLRFWWGPSTSSNT